MGTVPTTVVETEPPLPTGTPLAFALMSIFDRPWAMERNALRSLVDSAYRWDLKAALEAVAAREGQPLDNNGAVENYNGVAVVDIRGPLFRYRSIWTWLLGGTAVDQTAFALHAALDDPGVHSIVLAINSPGGQIDGVNELANMIRAANDVKPVTAYADGLAASGGYWLAAAAGRIVADETAQLGSIGVRATIEDDAGAAAKQGYKRYDIVSSQSPLKRQDPATDEGRAQLQQMVDALAQIFIGAVAKFRGTSESKVMTDFGRGAVLPARDAVAVGMADSLGSLEAVIKAQQTDLVRQIRNAPGLRVAAPVVQVADPFDEDELEEETEDTQLNNSPGCDCPDGECTCQGQEDEDESEGTEQEPDDSSIPEGETRVAQPTEPTQPQQQPQQQQRTAITTERQRIAAILTCEEATGREELARTLALETSHNLATAKKILAAAPKPAPAAPVNPLAAAMTQVANPAVGVPGDEQQADSPAAEVQRILGFVPKDRLRAHARVQ